LNENQGENLKFCKFIALLAGQILGKFCAQTGEQCFSKHALQVYLIEGTLLVFFLWFNWAGVKSGLLE